MAILQKNIWTIFYALILGALLFLGIISYLTWNSIHDEHAKDQTDLVRLVSNSTHSLLLTQEMVLDILGKQIVMENNPKMLDELLELNPTVLAFGFVDLNGTYLHINSQFNKAKLPNLKENPLTKDSFAYTLTQEKMVLGRTYFIAASGKWGIPIRKTIFDQNHTPVGVMTAGLNVDGSFKLFNESLSQGDSNKVLLVRDKDRFIQFVSSSREVKKEVYDNALPESFFEEIDTQLQQDYHITLQTAKQNNAIYFIELRHADGTLVQMALKYDPRYELWTFSQIEHQQLVNEFFAKFIIYVLIFVAVHIILFFFFNIIAHAENRRKNDLIFQATHDDLTKLPNRSYLKRDAYRWIYDKAPPFSLYYLDMDHFKNINDSFGHHIGDLLLIEFSKRLLRLVHEDSVIIRQGGDEFIILTSRSDESDILEHAHRILHEIAQPYQIHHFNFIIGASIGIAKYPEHGTNMDMLLRASDIAMYEAKKYKNSVRMFATSMQAGYLNRLNVEQALRTALDKQELYMTYQPQVDQAGVVYGVEALVRWKHPVMGMIPPNHFIPIAEAAGIMPRLGHWIVTTSLEEVKRLQDELGISFQTSLNISVKQFMEVNFLDLLLHSIEHHRLSKIHLCLEITESLFIEDIEYILPLLQHVHDMGIHISMDDFGTGYSSLSMLRKLPIDELKIDKSFVDTILEDVTAQKMIQNIITIGKNLDLAILAEGVETKEQEALLKAFGCDRFQGYLYSKPLDYPALKAFFATFQQKG